MTKKSLFFWVVEVLALVVMTTSCVGEVDRDPSDIHDPVGARNSALACPGHLDQVVAWDYWGAQEDVNTAYGDPALTGHAADAELVWYNEGAPSDEQFAVAWIPFNGGQAKVRIYDRATAAFLPEQTLNPFSYTRWVRKLGHDDKCTDVPGARSCAWFTWQGLLAGSEVVMWRALGDNNDLGPTHLGFVGYQPSGEVGRYQSGGQWLRKKLLAWIDGYDTERMQVKGVFLNNDGTPMGGDFVIHYVSSPMKAYQTAVAFSPQEQRWVVAWSEADRSGDSPLENGRIKTKYVLPDETVGPGNASGAGNFIQYCNQQISHCIVGKAASPMSSNGGAGQRTTNCACKGFWFTSSKYSQSRDDRFRLHHYDEHAILGANGQRVGPLYDPKCSTYCPMTESAYVHEKTSTPYQLLFASQGGEVETHHMHLAEADGATTFDEGYAIGARCDLPQAARANRTVSVAVSSSSVADNILRLSLTDLYDGGCWQKAALAQP